jgi:hypothetical protein
VTSAQPIADLLLYTCLQCQEEHLCQDIPGRVHVTSVLPLADLLLYTCLHVKKNISAKTFQLKVM